MFFTHLDYQQDLWNSLTTFWRLMIPRLRLLHGFSCLYLFQCIIWLPQLFDVARPNPERGGATDSVETLEFDQQQTDWYVTSLFCFGIRSINHSRGGLGSNDGETFVSGPLLTVCLLLSGIRTESIVVVCFFVCCCQAPSQRSWGD